MKPWSFWPAADFKPAPPGELNWQSLAQMQQEFWRRWLEAGRNWLAWWTPGLPEMPWPPAGQVADPRQEPASQAPAPSLAKRAARPRPASAAKPRTPAAARKSASQAASKGQRHH